MRRPRGGLGAGLARVLAGARHGAQAAQRLADDARDLHLRDADALADLGLREVLLEAQAQYLALTRRHRAQQLLERGPVLGQREAALVPPDGVSEGVAGIVLGAARGLQRRRAVRAGRLQRLEHLLLRGLDRLGDLGDRRLAV